LPAYSHIRLGFYKLRQTFAKNRVVLHDEYFFWQCGHTSRAPLPEALPSLICEPGERNRSLFVQQTKCLERQQNLAVDRAKSMPNVI
jgi:hypothetical protein